MAASQDVVIVGAGIIGASCAWQLASAGFAVTVVDSGSTPAGGSTGRSFGAIRSQWADPMNIALSWESVQRFRSFETDHGIDIGYQPIGYLMLVPASAETAHLAAVELQRSHGVPVEVLTPADAQARTPFVSDGIALATWGPADGLIDPRRATSAFLRLAQAAGARILLDHRVTAISHGPDDQWIIDSGESRVTGQYLVNAAGGWSGELAALAGLQVPVVHSRRSIYAASAAHLRRSFPMTVDLSSGVFLRTGGDSVYFSQAPTDQPPGYADTPDWEWFGTVEPRACRRFPWLSELPLDRTAAWGGTYEVTPDNQGILGPDPNAPTWINACGFSGHGLMQAPVIGSLVAEQLTTGAMTSFDVSGLRLERFAESTTLQHASLVV